MVGKEFLFLATLYSVSCAGQWTPDVLACESPRAAADSRIAACSLVIESTIASIESRSRAYFNRAFEWASKGDHDKAIDDYGEAIRLRPRNGQAFNNRGNSWAEKKEYEKAIRDYDEALRLNPGHFQAYSNRGEAWRERGEHERAIVDFDSAIRLNPNYAYAIHQRGRSWHALGLFARAIEDYDRSLRERSDQASVYNSRGIAWMDLGDPAKAIADLDTAIRLDPNYAAAYGNRGFARSFQGEHPRAIRDWTRAIGLDPRDPHYLRGLALAEYLAGRFRDSARHFDALLTRQANDTYARIWHRLALGRAGLQAETQRQAAIAVADMATADVSAREWEDIIANLLTGRHEAAVVLKAAAHPDALTRRARECEADFYIGEWHVVHGRTTEARRYLENAAARCPKSFSEYPAAVWSLKRLPEPLQR